MKIIRDTSIIARGEFVCSNCKKEIHRHDEYRHIIYETRDAIKIWRNCSECFNAEIRGLSYSKKKNDVIVL